MLINFDNLSVRTGNILKQNGITDTDQLKGIDLKSKIDNTMGWRNPKTHPKLRKNRTRKPDVWANFGRKHYHEFLEYLTNEYLENWRSL